MSKDKSGKSRREFLKDSAMTAAGLSVGINALTSPVFAQTSGANDKVRVGFIGLGNRGTQLLRRFMANPDVEVAAVCDVYEPYTLRDRSRVDARWLESGKVPEMGESFARQPKRYTDFRKLLEQKDIDAVCISTPDHWHAIQTIAALDAGKDVYVEKPLTITIHEGRQMVTAAAKTDRIVAVGLNRRGSSIYQELAGLVQGGKIGQVRTARAYRISNMYPDGIGTLEPEAPPPGFDWDMWLGPRPHRPYQYNIAPYYFRWWQDYSSQMGNWGVHFMDVIRWMTGEKAPVAITAHGSKLLQDDKTIPDTMEVTFEFANGMLAQFHIYESCGAAGISGGEIELGGTHGNLVASQNGYSISPVRPGQFQTWERLVEPEEKTLESDAQHGDLGYQRGLHCQPHSKFPGLREEPRDPVVYARRRSSFHQLRTPGQHRVGNRNANRVGCGSAEKVTNNPAANDLLHYEYRSPWSLS